MINPLLSPDRIFDEAIVNTLPTTSQVQGIKDNNYINPEIWVFNSSYRKQEYINNGLTFGGEIFNSLSPQIGTKKYYIRSMPIANSSKPPYQWGTVVYSGVSGSFDHINHITVTAYKYAENTFLDDSIYFINSLAIPDFVIIIENILMDYVYFDFYNILINGTFLTQTVIPNNLKKPLETIILKEVQIEKIDGSDYGTIFNPLNVPVVSTISLSKSDTLGYNFEVGFFGFSSGIVFTNIGLEFSFDESTNLYDYKILNNGEVVSDITLYRSSEVGSKNYGDDKTLILPPKCVKFILAGPLFGVLGDDITSNYIIQLTELQEKLERYNIGTQFVDTGGYGYFLDGILPREPSIYQQTGKKPRGGQDTPVVKAAIYGETLNILIYATGQDADLDASNQYYPNFPNAALDNGVQISGGNNYEYSYYSPDLVSVITGIGQKNIDQFETVFNSYLKYFKKNNTWVLLDTTQTSPPNIDPGISPAIYEEINVIDQQGLQSICNQIDSFEYKNEITSDTLDSLIPQILDYFGVKDEQSQTG